MKEDEKYMDTAGIKTAILTALGILGGFLSNLFGGWSASLTTLLIVMGMDYLSGLIVAGIFHRSDKTADGTLKSGAGWKGLCRKGMMLLVVLVGARLDLIMGTSIVRDGVIIAFVANECISIIENAGLMGIPIPAVIAKAISVLNGGDRPGDAD